MNNVFNEGNLQFDFTGCDTAERFDTNEKNAYGMKSVDFIAESADCLYFIEVKDYQHPNAPQSRLEADYRMLLEAVNGDESIFVLEMGTKIKDSLLRRYAEGSTFEKKVVYLLFLNLDRLGEFERGLLKTKISGHIPTGLNIERFKAFKEISLDLVNADQLTRYGIICASNSTA
jgi:hypothetical protein